MTAKQLLAHEMGHWFFNRFFDDKIGADKLLSQKRFLGQK